jgi:hypothetical protein
VSRDSFKWGLIGSLIILSATTIFSYAGWANLFSQDEDILSFLQVASLLAAIVAAVGLIVTRKPPADRPVLACQFLFDMGVHGVGKIAMISRNSIALVDDVLLYEPQSALSGLSGGRVPVFVNGPFGQGNAVYFTLGYQPAQDSQAGIDVSHGPDICDQDQIRPLTFSNSPLGVEQASTPFCCAAWLKGPVPKEAAPTRGLEELRPPCRGVPWGERHVSDVG